MLLLVLCAVVESIVVVPCTLSAHSKHLKLGVFGLWIECGGNDCCCSLSDHIESLSDKTMPVSLMKV